MEQSSIIDVVELVGQGKDRVVNNGTLKLFQCRVLLVSPILWINILHPKLHGLDGLLLQLQCRGVLIFHTISIRYFEGTLKQGSPAE